MARMEMGLGPGHIVLDRDPAPLKKGAHPQFSADVCCGQTSVCIRMPLGTEVGLSRDEFVLDGDPVLPTLKGTVPLQFSANVRCG